MGCSAPVEAPRSRQRDVDGLGLQRRIGWTRAERRVQQPLHQLLERFEALAKAFFASAERGLQPPVGNFVEPSLLAAQPFQAKRFHGLLAIERGRASRACASSAANALSSAASSNAVRLGIASFVMRNVQDKPLRAAAAARPRAASNLALTCRIPADLPRSS